MTKTPFNVVRFSTKFAVPKDFMFFMTFFPFFYVV